MGEFCSRCKMAANYKYWIEFPPVKHQFFKPLVGDFRTQLMIPSKFMEYFKGVLPNRCHLRGPSGNEWTVDLDKQDGKWMFVKAWENFVKDHHLTLEDLLVFTYLGGSSFDVTIFDKNACNKEVCFFVDEGTSSCSANSCIMEGHIMGQDYAAQDVNTRSEEDCKQKYKLYYVSNRREVTQEEKVSAYNKALEHSMNSKLSILITMLPTYVYRGFTLKIPKAWATEHIPRECKEIVLTVEGCKKEWHVGCKWTPLDQCQIRAKWQTFAWENNLEEDDVCVFKLVGDRIGPVLRMKTTIFRVVDPFVRLTMERP